MIDKRLIDMNGRPLTDGDIIDVHQTINGQNRFLVLNVKNLDIRYEHDVNRKYEYDAQELLSKPFFEDTVSWEIIRNIFK